MTTDVNVEPVAQIQVQEKKKRGFTLTEIAIVLGIIGLILGAIWVAAAAVYNNLRVSHANTEVLQIAQGVRALYATTNTITAGVITSAIACAGAVPSDMITGTACPAGPATMNDPWPSGTTVITGTTDGLGFVIAMSNVPAAACINLISSVAGTNRDPGLFVAQTGYAVTTTGSPLTVAANPTTAAAAAAGGIGGCTAATNTVSFGFALKS